MTRLWCALVGHEDFVQCRPGRLRAVCARCGRQTAGVELEPAYHRTQPPKGSRRQTLARLQRAWMAYYLRDVA